MMLARGRTIWPMVGLVMACGAAIAATGCMRSEGVSDRSSLNEALLASLYTVRDYDPARDPAVDLQAAVRTAESSGKRILLQIGGQWCGWCHRLDGYIAEHPEIAATLAEDFVIMKVNYSDENDNEAFLSQYPSIPGYPHLYVLAGDGTFLHSQGTAELEEGESYNAAAVLAFLEAWKG